MYTAFYLTGIHTTLLISSNIVAAKVGKFLCLYVAQIYRTNTLGAYLITPAMGSHFVMYLAKMKGLKSNIFSQEMYINLFLYSSSR